MQVLRLDQQKRGTAIGLHRRRLSSTPIKSTAESEPQKSGAVRLTQGMSLESGASVRTIGCDSLQSKVNGKTEGGQEPKDENEISDSGSESGNEEVTIKGTGFFSAPVNPTYNKRSYQDEGSLGDSASDGVEEDDESVGAGSDADGSTLIEDGGNQPRKVIFDDDDTWNDLDDTAVSTENDCRVVSPVPRMPAARISPTEKVMLRKVAASRAAELDAEAGPASQLMTRLFPSLQPKPHSPPPAVPPAVPPAAYESSKSQDDTGQTTLSSVQSSTFDSRVLKRFSFVCAPISSPAGPVQTA